MFWALTLILLAVAAFSVVVVRRPRRADYDHHPRLDVDQLQGFVYVGAAVLVLISIGVIVLGLVDRGRGKAEALAVLGFLGYALYLAASAAAVYLMSRTTENRRPDSRVRPETRRFPPPDESGRQFPVPSPVAERLSDGG